MSKKQNRKGLVLLALGLVLLLAAGILYLFNITEDKNAGKQASVLLDKITQQQSTQNTQKNLPVIIADGYSFCGTVIIDKLGTELPVFNDWNYSSLKQAPCRYSGSISENNIVIAAHNYKSHFGSLDRLQIDDEVIFVDAYGLQHKYAVKQITILDGTAVDNMKSGDWDFTLFTCTKSGEQRVTVRCNKVN